MKNLSLLFHFKIHKINLRNLKKKKKSKRNNFNSHFNFCEIFCLPQHIVITLHKVGIEFHFHHGISSSTQLLFQRQMNLPNGMGHQGKEEIPNQKQLKLFFVSKSKKREKKLLKKQKKSQISISIKNNRKEEFLTTKITINRAI
jgi:hypothetical protein